MVSQVSFEDRKPNWLLLKEAVQELVESGKTVFNRKEIVDYAKKKDPSRSEASLDYEIDLVTVNSSSKDKYRDPDKLFLYRIERGRYTLYNPETHGTIEEFILPKTSVLDKELVEQIARSFVNEGFEVKIVKSSAKPFVSNMVIAKDGVKIGVWIIPPNIHTPDQLKLLAYAIGSSILDRTCDRHIIVLNQALYGKIPIQIREKLRNVSVELKQLKEEKKYSILI